MSFFLFLPPFYIYLFSFTYSLLLTYIYPLLNFTSTILPLFNSIPLRLIPLLSTFWISVSVRLSVCHIVLQQCSRILTHGTCPCRWRERRLSGDVSSSSSSQNCVQDRDYLTLTHPLQRISSHSHGHLYNTHTTHTPFHSIQFTSVHHFPPFTIFLPSLLPSLYTSLPSSIFSSIFSTLPPSLFSPRKIITIFLLHCLYSLRVGEASLVTSNPTITHKYGFLFAYF